VSRIVIYAAVERKMEHKEEKGKLGRTMMQVLELLQLAERHISRQSNIEHCKKSSP